MQLLLMPILDGQALLYSFESTPELGVEIAFGGGGSQSMPANGLPGVSNFLVCFFIIRIWVFYQQLADFVCVNTKQTKLFTETLNKQLVEPRRGCFTLPVEEQKKGAVGGVVSVTIISAKRLKDRVANNDEIKDALGSSVFKTFVEVEIKNLTRRTEAVTGPDLEWDQEFNMYMHGESDIIKLNLCECATDSVKCEYLASCEIKVNF